MIWLRFVGGVGVCVGGVRVCVCVMGEILQKSQGETLRYVCTCVTLKFNEIWRGHYCCHADRLRAGITNVTVTHAYTTIRTEATTTTAGRQQSRHLVYTLRSATTMAPQQPSSWESSSSAGSPGTGAAGRPPHRDTSALARVTSAPPAPPPPSQFPPSLSSDQISSKSHQI